MSKIVGPNLSLSGCVLHLDAANPKSYQSGSTSWFDLSGNNNNGTLVSGSGYSSANMGSIVFDGVNDYVAIDNPSTIRNQDFTLSFWIKPEVQLNPIISIIDFDHANTPYQGWVLQSEDALNNGYYYLAWNDGSAFQPSGGGGFGVGKGIQITTSVWQNITYSKNGTTLFGYKNGNQVYTGIASNGTVSYLTNRNLRIGGVIYTGSGVGNRTYKGSMGLTQVYNRSLSSNEVLQNYNALKSRYQ